MIHYSLVSKGPALRQESVGTLIHPPWSLPHQSQVGKRRPHRSTVHRIFRSGWKKWIRIYPQKMQRKQQRNTGTAERVICMDTAVVDSSTELGPVYGYMMGNKWQVQVQRGQNFKENLWLCYENHNGLLDSFFPFETSIFGFVKSKVKPIQNSIKIPWPNSQFIH